MASSPRTESRDGLQAVSEFAARQGQVFDGRYRIERRLSQSGQAETFLATDASDGSTVVIKAFPQRRSFARHADASGA